MTARPSMWHAQVMTDEQDVGPPVEAGCICGRVGVIALTEDVGSGQTVWIEHRDGQMFQRHSHCGADLIALKERISMRHGE
jgi:hypothetical protein